MFVSHGEMEEYLKNKGNIEDNFVHGRIWKNVRPERDLVST